MLFAYLFHLFIFETFYKLFLKITFFPYISKFHAKFLVSSPFIITDIAVLELFRTFPSHLLVVLCWTKDNHHRFVTISFEIDPILPRDYPLQIQKTNKCLFFIMLVYMTGSILIFPMEQISLKQKLCEI